MHFRVGDCSLLLLDSDLRLSLTCASANPEGAWNAHAWGADQGGATPSPRGDASLREVKPTASVLLSGHRLYSHV
jgi:hypothetical protein